MRFIGDLAVAAFFAGEKDNASHSKVLQQVVNGLRDNPNYVDRIRELMLDHFRKDWKTLTGKGLDSSMSEGLQFRRSLFSETLRGEYVKSRGEKLIADFLFEHGDWCVHRC